MGNVQILMQGKAVSQLQNGWTEKYVFFFCEIFSSIREEVWERWGTTPPFLNSATDGGEWLATPLGPFTPGERAPIIHWMRD
jgi:hypothetical protein